jgi:DNA-binding NtrC family response regulator
MHPAKSTPGPRRPESRCGVLVVDDDSSLRRSLEEALQPLYRVWTSPSVQGAQEVLDRQPGVHGVLVDAQLPGGSGLEFGKRLRSTLPRLKLFLMTGVDQAPVAREVFKMRASAFLPKPFSTELLLLMLASHLLPMAVE